MRIAVVGTCASGKSSVVAVLRARGIDAWAVAQEHSAIPHLWAHLRPERLVLLDVSLESMRCRRNDATWPEWIYEAQRSRLADARDHADVTVDTDRFDLDGVVREILRALIPA